MTTVNNCITGMEEDQTALVMDRSQSETALESSDLQEGHCIETRVGTEPVVSHESGFADISVIFELPPNQRRQQMKEIHDQELLCIITQRLSDDDEAEEARPVPLLECIQENLNLLPVDNSLLQKIAVEAAIITQSYKDGATEDIVQALKSAGIGSVTKRVVQREADRLRPGICRKLNMSDVLDYIEDAPVLSGAIFPADCISDLGAIYRVQGLQRKLVCQRPIVILGCVQNVCTNQLQLLVAWKTRDGWKTELIDRQALTSTKKIKILANIDMPVNASNAKAVVEYLAAYEAANYDQLPRAYCARQLGWHKVNGQKVFLLGDKTIYPDETRVSGADIAEVPSLWNGSTLLLQSDKVAGSIARGYRLCGTENSWADAIKSIAPFPKVQLAVYAAFTPPLLDIMGVPNFVVDICGQSSGGKTTALRAAASVWGNPSEDSQDSLVKTWNSTAAYRDRIMGSMSHLPCFIDETTSVSKRSDLSEFIYNQSSGQGKGRAHASGVQETNGFRSVVFCTGESRMVDSSQNGGIRARTLTLHGSPFGKTDSETAKVVNALKQTLRGNYGFAGESFVKYVAQHQGEWAQWKEEIYQPNLEQFEQWADDSPFRARIAPMLALIETAAQLAHEAGAMPGEYHPVFDENLYEQIGKEVEQADQSSEAVQDVVQWVENNSSDFYSTHSDRNKPSRKWHGRWDRKDRFGPFDPGSNTTHLSFDPEVLKSRLQKLGYDPKLTLDAWHDRGWLSHCEGRRTKKVRIKDASLRYCSLNLDKIRQDLARKESA